MIANSEVVSVHFAPSHVSQPEHEPQIDLDKLVQDVDWALRRPGMTVLIHGDIGLNQKHLVERLEAQSGRVRSFVIHSFDELNMEAQRAGFVAFIKQIEDRRAPIHLVLCSVSEALRELVAMHESCYNFEERESTDPRIIPEADFTDDVWKGQDADQSNVYLVSEGLLWDMFNDPTFARSLW
ncbi:MAG TPA: hypothetical protein VFF64_19455 [Candidatus Eremiobacteraceae bacterium]|nr:hypothetical protein [Candidatus Eremiobacteraceae bacterium]